MIGKSAYLRFEVGVVTVVDVTRLVALLQRVNSIICAHVKYIRLIPVIVDFPSALRFIMGNELAYVLVDVIALLESVLVV